MFQTTPNREPVTLVEQSRQYKHRRRLLLAMAILLTALAVFLVRDRDIWFGSDDTAEAQDTWTGPTQLPNAATQQPVAATTNEAATAPESAPHPSDAKATVTSNRVSLPPVEMNVVANDTRHSSASKVSTTSSQTASGPLTTAAQREVEQPAVASYPLLASQMKVEGSVLMQALIAADGSIEELHVISGPAILAVAARQAVQNWHFKPYVQNGQAVETQARVTVNFTIKVMNDVVSRRHSSGMNSNGL
jgi:TonB family protein